MNPVYNRTNITSAIKLMMFFCAFCTDNPTIMVSTDALLDSVMKVGQLRIASNFALSFSNETLRTNVSTQVNGTFRTNVSTRVNETFGTNGTFRTNETTNNSKQSKQSKEIIMEQEIWTVLSNLFYLIPFIFCLTSDSVKYMMYFMYVCCASFFYHLCYNAGRCIVQNKPVLQFMDLHASFLIPMVIMIHYADIYPKTFDFCAHVIGVILITFFTRLDYFNDGYYIAAISLFFPFACFHWSMNMLKYMRARWFSVDSEPFCYGWFCADWCFSCCFLSCFPSCFPSCFSNTGDGRRTCNCFCGGCCDKIQIAGKKLFASAFCNNRLINFILNNRKAPFHPLDAVAFIVGMIIFGIAFALKINTTIPYWIGHSLWHCLSAIACVFLMSMYNKDNLIIVVIRRLCCIPLCKDYPRARVLEKPIWDTIVGPIKCCRRDLNENTEFNVNVGLNAQVGLNDGVDVANPPAPKEIIIPMNA